MSNEFDLSSDHEYNECIHNVLFLRKKCLQVKLSVLLKLCITQNYLKAVTYGLCTLMYRSKATMQHM